MEFNPAILFVFFVTFCLKSVLAVGPIAQWDFDEGRGTTVSDATGNGHDGVLKGDASWVSQADGFAVRVDGAGQHVDCGQIEDFGMTGPVSLEAWVKPTVKGHGEAHLIGAGMSSFVLTYYNAELCYWYIGSGGNNLRGALALHGWNHVVATFDGETMSQWVNGRLVGTQESRHKEYPIQGAFHIGSSAGGDSPRFEGMIDRVRLYDRAISPDEAIAHFKEEAVDYGFDPAWFRRVKVTPFYYLDRNEIFLEVNYQGLQPLAGSGKLEMVLAKTGELDQVIISKMVDSLPEDGELEVRLTQLDLADGEYRLRVRLEDARGDWPLETFDFTSPSASVPLPAPADKMAEPIPPPAGPTPYDFAVDETGGFTITINGRPYPFRSRVSWPHGDFNHLGEAGPTEPSWTVVTDPGKHKDVDEPTSYSVKATGAHYQLHREISAYPTHVSIRDTYFNRTDEDLGLIIYNETALGAARIKKALLGGFEGRMRATSAGSAEIFSPSVFFTDDNSGIGIVPIDDVFVVQCVLYADGNTPGIGTERFALGPGASYTLEWAVYPTGSGDYYDFVNAFRTVEDRIGKVDGGLSFISFGPMNRRQVPSESFVENRGMKYAIVHTLSRAADDPEVSIEGIEFVDFPEEMKLVKRQSAAFHRKYPDRKIMFHVAHSLYMTDKPDRFPDSKVILENGEHAVWGASEPYVTKQRQDEGWTWWIYYPVEGNSFHDALMDSVDVMIDDLGMDGVFMDGFLAGYMGTWSYDGRWDGHSAEIDPATKTITRKMASVLLLSQPSMIAFARKVRDKGGVVVANNTMMTRSMAAEKHIIFDQEVASGPHLHFGPSVTALARGPFDTEKDFYVDMLDKLQWGELFVYYLDRIHLTGPSLAAFQYPMEFKEIRSGLVRGSGRIVTMNSGVYGWPGDDQLHQVYSFDQRGALVPNRFLTTIEQEEVRTQLDFEPNESAVIVPIPVQVDSGGPVNARVMSYDGSRMEIELNGAGTASLGMFVGTSYPDRRDGVYTDGGMNPSVVGVGDRYRVQIHGTESVIEEIDGLLTVPLQLDGMLNMRIDPER